jgi:hypothetical protein
MNIPWLAPVLLSLLFGFGVFICTTAFTLKVSLMPLGEDGRPVSVNSLIGEPQIIYAMIADIVRLVPFLREGNDLVDKLRRSRWRFKSANEYHAWRVINALIGLGGAFIAVRFLELDLSTLPFLLTAGAVGGFFWTDKELNDAIQKRREQIESDMAFGLITIAQLVNAGKDPRLAMSEIKNAGEFGTMVGEFASKYGTAGDPTALIEKDILPYYPKSEDLASFFFMVVSSGKEGLGLEAPLKAMGAKFQNDMRIRQIEAAKRADIYISLVGSTVMLMAILIAVVTPMVDSLAW